MSEKVNWDDFTPVEKSAPVAKTKEVDWSQFEPAKPVGALRKLGDLGAGFASGAIGASKSVADAAGAGNSVSGALDTADKFTQGLLSPQAKADQQEQQGIMKEASGKGVLDQIGAAGRAFAVAPVQTTVQELGSIVPTIAAGLATGGASVPVSLGAMAAMGAAQGAGAVKGGIYDDIKQRSAEAGMDPATAEARALSAQEYGGPNTAQIALGGALGTADAATGVSKVATSMIRRGMNREAAQLVEGSSKGILARTALGAAGEVPLEAAQGGQQQYATNAASNREGFDVNPWDGVVAQGVFEGLASAGPGAAFGAANRGGNAPASLPATEVAPATADPLGLPPPSITVDSAGQAMTTDQRQSLRDTSGATDVIPRAVAPAPTAAQSMGIDETAGPLSKSASIAVNSGLTDALTAQAETAALVEQQANDLKNQPKKTQTQQEQDQKAIENVAQPPQKTGAFATEDEARGYISDQKRAGGMRTQALPLPQPDGSFGVAIAGSPDYTVAEFHQKQSQLRAAGVLDGDTLTKAGGIFPNRLGAANAARKAGAGFETVPVTGGFVVRKSQNVVTGTPANEQETGASISAAPPESQASAEVAQRKDELDTNQLSPDALGTASAQVSALPETQQQSVQNQQPYADTQQRPADTSQPSPGNSKELVSSANPTAGDPASQATPAAAVYQKALAKIQAEYENDPNAIRRAAAINKAKKAFEAATTSEQKPSVAPDTRASTAIENVAKPQPLEPASVQKATPSQAKPATQAAPVEAPAPGSEPESNRVTAGPVPGTAGVEAAGLKDQPTDPQQEQPSAQTPQAIEATPQRPAAPATSEVKPRPATWRTNMIAASKVARDMGIAPKGMKLAEVVSAIDAADGTPQAQAKDVPVQLGRNNTPMSEGGKPFKTKLAATTAKKLQPVMRVVRVEGGYALAEKTPAQLAAEVKAARRLRNPQTSPAGEAIPAHAMIAAEGGLAPAERADMGMEGNVSIGNRKLFAGVGKGLTIERATEKLIEDGYLPDDASHQQARDLIKRSLNNPQYTPEGTERMAEKEAVQREADYNAEQEAIALAQEAEDNALADAADAYEVAVLELPESQRQEDMDFDAALLAAGYTQQEIEDDQAIAVDTSPAQAVAATDQSPVEAATGARPQSDSGREGAPGAVQGQDTGLTAPSQQDILDQQQRAADGEKANASQRKADQERLRRAQERKDIAKASEAAAGTFELGGSAEQNLSGQQDVFGNPPADQPSKTSAKQFSSAKIGKIEDSGAVLEGAAKLYAKAYFEKFKEGIDMDIAAVPLSKSWPEPDYQRMLDDGADPWALAFARSARDEVPNKPGTAWKVKGWAAKVQLLRGFAGKVLDGTYTKDQLVEAGDGLHLSAWFNKIDLYEAVGHAESLKGLTFQSGQYGMYGGQTFNPPKTLWAINKPGTSNTATWRNGNWGNDLVVEDTKAGAIKKYKEWAATQSEKAPTAAKAATFDIYSYRSKPGVFIVGKRLSAGSSIDLKEFATVKEAREYKTNNQAELEKLLEAEKYVPPERKEANAPRVGADHRNGADITNEQFRDAFGFRGEQFGQSMPQNERQSNLNQTYDALMDLAGVIGVPPKALSLNGELGMAFGARGKGGKRPAAAHYEADTTGAVTPNRVVINLTRKNGAGSLAHEWFHAVDNYFARKQGQKSGFMTERIVRDEGVRKEMKDAFTGLMRSINSTALARRSKELDKTRSKAYWSTGLEMAARSFESYVIAKLQDQNGSNDYLANIVSETEFEKENAYPYLTAGELPTVRAAFDSFFDTVQAVDTDNGVALQATSMDAAAFEKAFAPAAPMTVEAAQAVVDRVTAKWTNGPRIVVLKETADIPPGLKIKGNPRGVYTRDVIYIIAANNRSADQVAQTLAHEAIAHHGLRGLLGPLGHLQLMKQVAAGIARGDPALVASSKYVDRAYANQNLSAKHRADEVAAHVVEMAVDPVTGEFKPGYGFLKMTFARIAAFLRRIGIDVPFTLSELHGMLVASMRNLETGRRTYGGGVGVVAAARDGDALSAAGRGTNASVTNPKDVVGKNQSGRSADDTSPGAANKAVDSKGKPVTVYHGTPRVFDKFEAKHISSGMYGEGFYFTTLKDDAELYAEGGRVISATVTITNPASREVAETVAERIGEDEYTAIRQELQRMGYDGVIAKGFTAGETTYVTFTSGQINLNEPAASNSDDATLRSAGADPDILMATEAPDRATAIGDAIKQQGGNPHSWDALEESRFDDLVYKLQDKQIDTKRVVDSIKATSGALADEKNVYLQEELFHGRAASRTEDFVNKELGPLVNMMKMRSIDIPMLDEYLHARHAEEANKLIAERNPEILDGGSGMTTQAARDYLAKLTPAERNRLDVVAAKVDGILANTRQLYADYDLESQEKVDGWGTMFKHYVPLMREEKDGGMGIGQGFSIKGKEVKGRTGSTRKVVDILANIALQRERAIVRGEKNRVATALVGLVNLNPNKAFWNVGPPPATKVYDPASNSVVERQDPLYKSRDNVVMAKVKGKDGVVTEQAVTFNEDDPRALRMAMSLKNLDAAQLEGLLGVSAKITRYFAAINTQYNPIFGTVNLVRDVQGALFNLTSTPLKGKALAIAGHTLSALKGIYMDARATRDGKVPTSQWAALWDDFQAEGGQTGFRDLFANSADRAKAIERELNPTAWMDSPLGKVFTADGTLKVPLAVAQKKATGMFDWLSDYNLAMENAVRLAAYKVALEQGISKQQSASLGKNLTVNFNRKGQVGQQAGALYAFFNASMQGTARLGETLFDMEPGKPKTIRMSATGKKIIYGGILLGSMQALLLAGAGFDDEEPPDFVRERSLIIPTGGKTYITIPMPLGLHVLPNMGRIPMEFAMGGFKDPVQTVSKLIGLFANSFNPIGGGASLVQMLAPTAIDPLVAIAENKDWTGKPIAKTAYNKATPGHLLAKDTATAPAKMLSEAINFMSGGTEYTAGVLSPTPDQIDYLFGQVTGGVGREVSKLQQSGSAMVSGEDLPIHKVPLVGRFYGDTDTQSAQSGKFYSAINKINVHEAEIKGLRKDGKGAEATQYIQENPEARLFMAANMAEREVQNLRAAKRALIAKDAPADEVKAMETRINERMTRFNLTMQRLREKEAA